MELLIETNEFKVLVDTEDNNFKKGNILCGYCVGLFDVIQPYWHLFKVTSDKMGKFHRLVNKTYKVKKIYGETGMH